MGLLDKIEEGMRRAVEGPFGFFFPTRLQPVELEHRLQRAMEDNLTITGGRTIAPNYYVAYLSRPDYAAFTALAHALEQQHAVDPKIQTMGERLADSLITLARQRNYLMTTAPIIRLVEDPHVAKGHLNVTALVRDPRAPGYNPAEANLAGMTSIEMTRAMTADEAAEWQRQQNAQAGRQPDMQTVPPAWLTPTRPRVGQPMRMVQSSMRIGRGSDNDVIINDGRVSRYHAVITYEHGHFLLYDLESKNGVQLNGVLIDKPVPLRNNDRIIIGGYEFVFQRR